MLAGLVHLAGCPADVSRGAVRVNRDTGDRHRRSDALGQVRGCASGNGWKPVTHLGGTSELMTQIHDA
jgi:hypothetical protein